MILVGDLIGHLDYFIVFGLAQGMVTFFMAMGFAKILEVIRISGAAVRGSTFDD